MAQSISDMIQSARISNPELKVPQMAFLSLIEAFHYAHRYTSIRKARGIADNICSATFMEVVHSDLIHSAAESDSGQAECRICLETMEICADGLNPNTPTIFLKRSEDGPVPCHNDSPHVFHYRCIFRWVVRCEDPNTATCPTCRAPLADTHHLQELAELWSEDTQMDALLCELVGIAAGNEEPLDHRTWPSDLSNSPIYDLFLDRAHTFPDGWGSEDHLDTLKRLEEQEVDEVTMPNGPRSYGLANYGFLHDSKTDSDVDNEERQGWDDLDIDDPLFRVERLLMSRSEEPEEEPIGADV